MIDISKVDLVAINDVVKTAEKNWGQVSEEAFRNSDIKQPFTVIDRSENVLYQTPENQFHNINDAIDDIRRKLGNDGQILVRASGTEPLIRVMVEAEDDLLCNDYVYSIVDLIKDKGYQA